MSARLFELPPEHCGLANARIILARENCNDDDFKAARQHLLDFGTDADRSAARRATRLRRMRSLAEKPSYAAPPTKPADVEFPPPNAFLPAADPACSARGTTTTAARSAAVVFSSKIDRIVSFLCWLALISTFAFAAGVHHGRDLARSFASSQH